MTALADEPLADGLPPHGDRARRGAAQRRGLPVCTCPPCFDAHRGYENDRYRQIAYGRWQPFVDAAPARAHVEALLSAGLSVRAIAGRCGMSKERVRTLVRGRHGQLSKLIRSENAAAILAVRPDPATPSEGVLIKAVGRQRRLRALSAIGYTQKYLGNRLGLSSPDMARLVHRHTHVRASTAAAVDALYDELWMTPGPSERARQVAARNGWAAPLAWEDGTIDDPDAEPLGTDSAEIARIMRGDLEVELHEPGANGLVLRPVTVEAIRRLAAEGLADREISARLGGRLSRVAVATLRQRNGIPSGKAARQKAAQR